MYLKKYNNSVPLRDIVFHKKKTIITDDAGGTKETYVNNKILCNVRVSGGGEKNIAQQDINAIMYTITMRNEGGNVDIKIDDELIYNENDLNVVEIAPPKNIGRYIVMRAVVRL